MSEHEERDQADDQDVESAAPSDEGKVAGDGADVPAGQGEQADEAGSETEREEDADREDNRDDLAREIESDPASNPQDPELRGIKGG